jgi:spore coat protein U-like protein
MKTQFRLALALALAAFATPVFAAGTATATFTVLASVSAKCSVVAPTSNLDFTTYDPTAVSQASLDVKFHCTKGTTWNVSLDGSAANNGKGLSGSHAMASGADYLGYELYVDSARTQVWSPSFPVASGKFVKSGTGTGGSGTDTVTVYGQVDAGQYVTPGSYTDTVTFTVNY